MPSLKTYAKKFTKKFPGYKECLNYESVNEIIETIKEEILKTKSPLVGKILDYEYRK